MHFVRCKTADYKLLLLVSDISRATPVQNDRSNLQTLQQIVNMSLVAGLRLEKLGNVRIFRMLVMKKPELIV